MTAVFGAPRVSLVGLRLRHRITDFVRRAGVNTSL